MTHDSGPDLSPGSEFQRARRYRIVGYRASDQQEWTLVTIELGFSQIAVSVYADAGGFNDPRWLVALIGLRSR